MTSLATGSNYILEIKLFRLICVVLYSLLTTQKCYSIVNTVYYISICVFAFVSIACKNIFVDTLRHHKGMEEIHKFDTSQRGRESRNILGPGIPQRTWHQGHSLWHPLCWFRRQTSMPQCSFTSCPCDGLTKLPVML